MVVTWAKCNQTGCSICNGTGYLDGCLTCNIFLAEGEKRETHTYTQPHTHIHIHIRLILARLGTPLCLAASPIIALKQLNCALGHAAQLVGNHSTRHTHTTCHGPGCIWEKKVARLSGRRCNSLPSHAQVDNKRDPGSLSPPKRSWNKEDCKE